MEPSNYFPPLRGGGEKLMRARAGKKREGGNTGILRAGARGYVGKEEKRRQSFNVIELSRDAPLDTHRGIN